MSKIEKQRIQNPKNKRVEIRLTEDESNLIEECSKELNVTKTDVILKGINLVKAEIDKKK